MKQVWEDTPKFDQMAPGKVHSQKESVYQPSGAMLNFEGVSFTSSFYKHVTISSWLDFKCGVFEWTRP